MSTALLTSNQHFLRDANFIHYRGRLSRDFSGEIGLRGGACLVDHTERIHPILLGFYRISLETQLLRKESSCGLKCNYLTWK